MADMQTIYVRINWENSPSSATALGATNLNKMDLALSTIDGRVVSINTTKLDLATANTMVQNVTVDANGVFTITKLDGTITTYDTKIEKIAVNFAFDSVNQRLVLTLEDGTVQYVDMSSLVTEYEFVDSSTIGFTQTTGNISAFVKDGSITDAKLQPNYLADITVQAQNASNSASSALTSEQNANTSAILSQSYAVGGTASRVGEDTDNAKYYKEQAQQISGIDTILNDTTASLNQTYSSMKIEEIKGELNSDLGDKLDKTGDSKDNTVSFVEATTEEDIISAESHATIFGKILKSINTFRTFIGEMTSLKTTVKTDLVSSINELYDDKLSKKNMFVNVKDYGAVGDGVTDDTTAINSAIAYINSKGGGAIYFPSGIYLISSTLVINRYTSIFGDNVRTTWIKCASTFTASYNSCIAFRYETNHCDSVSMSDIAILLGGKDIHGITGFSVYDNAVFKNVNIFELGATASAFRFIPNENIQSTDPVSQTMLFLNCLAIVGTNASTGSMFYFESVQETTIIGCKAFGTLAYPSLIVGKCVGFDFEGCRGITMIGNSVGGNTNDVYPIRIRATNRYSSGFMITGTTFEATQRILYIKGTATNIIDNVTFMANRNEGSGGSGQECYFEYISKSNIEILTGNWQEVNVTNSIIRSTGNVNISQGELILNPAGVPAYYFSHPWSVGTGFTLLVNNGTTTTLKRVEIGAADSGGTGYRMLRVLN